jgi:SSS family solute:Na+ symporter
MVGYKVLPLGLRAIFLCGILAAVFTASVNYLLVAGATLGREISQWVGRGQSALNDMKWSRLGILLSAALAAVLALVVPSVIDLWYAWSGCSIGALLFPVLLSYSRRRYVYHRTSILVGMLGGYLISVGWFLYSKYSGNLLYPIKIADGQTWMMGTTLPGVLGFLTFGGVSHYFLKSKKAGTASLDFEKIEGEDVREEPRVLEELTLSS